MGPDQAGLPMGGGSVPLVARQGRALGISVIMGPSFMLYKSCQRIVFMTSMDPHRQASGGVIVGSGILEIFKS